MEKAVHQRLAPALPDDLGTEDDVAQRAGLPVRKLVTAVEREREDVRRLVDTEVLALERAHLVARDPRDAELAVGYSFSRDDPDGERLRRGAVDRYAASVVGLDRDHRRRAVPVSSA